MRYFKSVINNKYNKLYFGEKNKTINLKNYYALFLAFKHFKKNSVLKYMLYTVSIKLLIRINYSEIFGLQLFV